MPIPSQLSKNLLLVSLLKECKELLTQAYERLGDAQFQEVAEFADSAHSLLLKEVFEEKPHYDKKS